MAHQISSRIIIPSQRLTINIHLHSHAHLHPHLRIDVRVISRHFSNHILIRQSLLSEVLIFYYKLLLCIYIWIVSQYYIA
jgi:hypothetical protein